MNTKCSLLALVLFTTLACNLNEPNPYSVWRTSCKAKYPGSDLYVAGKGGTIVCLLSDGTIRPIPD